MHLRTQLKAVLLDPNISIGRQPIMRFSSHIIAVLAEIIACVNAAPQTPATVLSTTVSPTVITGDKMGAAAFTGAYDSTMVVYQAEDTSIHSLYGSGPPATGSSYASSLLLAAGIARNDTPLALVVYGGLYTTVCTFLSF